MPDPMKVFDTRSRALRQGIPLLLVCPIGALGFVASLEDPRLGGLPVTIMFGTVTPLAFALGVWLIRRSRSMKGAPPDPGGPVPWKPGM